MESKTRFTVRDIARMLDERLHRVKYAIAEYGIEPVERVGIIRIFSIDQIPQIKSALARTAERSVACA